VKFAAWPWLFGTGVAGLVAVLLVVSGVLLLRARRRFGDDERMIALITSGSGGRRAFKGVLLVLALAFAFLAAAQPQYGRGTRRIPATNLDVAIVLDFSKSMYARDVTPSRIERAKSEVASLIRELPGARFGAIAFAGEPMAFPLTSDGGAISQFLRQLSPNDMPVGGTAIGRALTAAHEVLTRDPLAEKSKQVVLLITDGEDLEGNPVSVAQALAADGITIHVVQIGGRTPEPIPDVDDQGEMVGWRTDSQGQPLTTSLSADGEAALTKIAEATNGMVVRSAKGTTGIREVAARMRVLMTEELSENVETVYADVFHYPLGLAIILLLIETFVGQAGARRRISKDEPSKAPDPPRTARERPRRKPEQGELERAVVAVLIGFSLAGASTQVVGCEAVDGAFVRHAPAVDEAIGALDAGDAAVAVELLESYLNTGACEDGEIGAPPSLNQRPGAGFDLGLGLFRLAEEFGRRFGEEGAAEATEGQADPQQVEARADRVRCALRIVRAVTGDRSVPVELRARAHYLAGNLEFLRENYRDAVTEYDQALRLNPGAVDASAETLGNDIAWNRAIALRRLEEQQDEPDAGPDAEPDAADDAGEDAGDDAGEDAGDDGGEDAGDDGGEDAGDDGGDAGDDGGDAGDDGGDAGDDGGGAPADAGADADDGDGQDAGPPPDHEDTPPEDQPEASQDERILDDLEQAPTLQQHDARQRANRGRRVRGGMEDK
jgi:Ca-activated chloride channel family protein